MRVFVVVTVVSVLTVVVGYCYWRKKDQGSTVTAQWLSDHVYGKDGDKRWK